MICLTVKSSESTVKAETLPSLEPFLVSTLRSIRSKLRARILLILTTSSSAMSSSMLSIIMPRSEYSRMLLTSSKLLEPLEMAGPLNLKATILRLSGSTMIVSMRPIGLEA